MITSTAPGNILDRIRRMSGPNPEDSKIKETERLHLIWLLTTLLGAITDGMAANLTTVLDVRAVLTDLGLSDQDVAAVLDAHPGDPAAMADAIATHPSLRTADYLD